MQKYRILIGIIVISLMVGFLQAEELRKVRLQLKWQHQFQFAGYYTAIEKGFYKEAGFEVELLPPIDNDTPFKSVLAGEAEFGTSTTDILIARDRGENVVVLATIFQHSPHVIISLMESGIHYAQDLVGKRIAADPGAAELYAYLIAEGVALNRCTFVDLTYDYRQLTDGSIDALISYSTDEPYSFAKAGYEINIIYPASAGIDFYGDLLFTSEELFEKDPRMVEAFRAASLKGWKYAMDHTGEIVDLIYNKYSRRHSKEHLQFEADQMQKLILSDVIEIGYTNPGRWQAILDTYKLLGTVDNSLSIDGLIYTEHLGYKTFLPLKIILIFSTAIIFLLVLFYFYYHLSRRLRKEIQQKEISQRNLAEKESLYRSILKASPDDVTITDLHGVIKEVSLKALTLVGCDSEEQMIGKSIADFVHPDDVGRALSSGRALLKGEEFEQGEYRLLRKDGTYIDTEINADLIKDPHGNAGGIVMVIRDISERKTHEAELQEKNAELIRFNAEKDKFFSIIAHDLRSPFNAFLGLTQMLSEDVGDMQHNEIQNLANTLNKSATNLLRLLENLLQWARMERGLTIPKPANFSLNKLIEETLSVFLDSAKYKDVAVTTDLAKDSIVFSDYDMTKTIIRNLLSNALKYTHTGGKISLSTTALENGFIKVTVKDNGIGMTQQIMDNLFSIDIDNRRPGTEGESSTGLGLVLCKEFVEANGGNLFVSSEEDKGSSFEFTLPQATKIQD